MSETETRRSVLKRAGGIAGTTVLGMAAVSESASAQSSEYEFTIRGRTIGVRITKDDAMSGSASVDMGDGYQQVVQRFEGFLNFDDDYMGIKFDVTEDVEAIGKLAMAAVVMGIAAAIPTQGFSAFASGALTTFAVGLMSDFADIDQFTIGIRRWKVMNTWYHVKTIDKGFNESVGGTVPMTEPKQGAVF